MTEPKKSGGFDLSNYVDVAERMAMFREKYPEGSVQTTIVQLPDAFAASFIAVEARAYRAGDDPRPGVDTAWEPVPGKTPYTRDSELMNASTSAIGRAIVAALAADTKRGMASADEIRNRRADNDAAAAERDALEGRAHDDGWDSVQQREAEFSRLKAETDALPADEKRLVVAEVAKAEVTSWLTREQATWWAEIIALAQPRAESSLSPTALSEEAKAK